MSKIVLDLETQESFQDVGIRDPRQLRISLVGIYNYATGVFETFDESNIKDLWPQLEKAELVIGYNLLDFDYLVLEKYYSGIMGNFPTCDLLQEVKKILGFRTKLDDLASATLGQGKSAHGLLAIEFFRQGEIDKLKEYCLDDVRLTRDLYEYALKNGKVLYRDGDVLREILIPREKLEPGQKKTINFTLPI